MGIKNQHGFAPVALLVITLLGVAIGVYLVQNYTSFLPKAFSTSPTLSLTPENPNFNRGCEYSFDIMEDTAGYDTDGTDVILKYDPTIITVLSAQGAGLYPEYPPVSIDNTAGKVKISGLASVTSPFAGSGKFATVKLKVNSTGTATTTKLAFDFDPANPYKTTDSNIVENRTVVDVLSVVKDANITIGSGTSCSATGSSPDISAVLQSGKAVVNWASISSPTIFDKVEIFQTLPGETRKHVASFYTSNCATQVPADNAVPKDSGTCSIDIADPRGEYSFRLFQNTAVAFAASSPSPTPSTPAGTADLVVTDISWTPASPSNGNQVTFSATVKNQGNASTPAGTTLGVLFKVNNTPTNWSDTQTASLAPGASITLTANGGVNGNSSSWIAALGTNTIMAHVDDVNRISESNEGNNTLSKTLVISSTLPSPSPSATSKVNLLKNSSLESLIDGYPADWWKRAGATSDSLVFRTGSKSLKVIGPALTTYSQQTSTLSPSTKYTASAWIKTQNIQGAGIGIRYAKTNTPSEVLGRAVGNRGTSDWKRISFTFTTPASYTKGRIDLFWELNQGDIGWFDDISICAGEVACL